ncbi:MAG: MauE/DoxX family redox-associated membrane protein [Acidithiobacillales bacterium]
MTPLRGWLGSEWLVTRVQIALGLFFVVAALPKLSDPPSFAHMIYNYRLLPGALVNLFALVLPWLELLSGVALLLGVWSRTGAAVVGVLLLLFVAAISINLLRGNAIECGCFDVRDIGKPVAERLSDMRWDLLRDLGMLAMVGQLLWATGRAHTAGEVS